MNQAEFISALEENKDLAIGIDSGSEIVQFFL